MALVRVYCGLSSKQAAGAVAGGDGVEPLTVAVVDDSGRLLHVREIVDSAAGFAELGTLLAERSGGADVAVAADSDEHQVTLLLAAAGRPLAFVDEESLDDYAERFGDDDSPEEMEAPTVLRHAIGLARALQAGALAASVRSAPRELTALKPVLAAHAAMVSGRQAAAVALREVLRELYPEALRAYPDPCEPVPLAILDALPEPGLLGSTAATRSRDEAVVTELSTAGLGDAKRIGDAVTALRVAISETPRRTGVGKSLTAAVTETIRQSVAAVRACDSAAAALIGLLAEKAPVSANGRRSKAQAVRPVREPAAAAPAAEAAAEPARSRRARTTIPPSSRGVAAAAASVGAPPAAPLPQREAPVPPPVAPPLPPLPPLPSVPPLAAPAAAVASPTSAPPGPAHRQPDHLAAGPAHAAPDERTGGYPMVPPPAEPYPYSSPAYASVPIPAPRPAPEVAPPGSRTDWPLTNTGYQPARAAAEEPLPERNGNAAAAYPMTSLPPTVLDRSGQPVSPAPSNGRVAPPWQDAALSGEPPTLDVMESSYRSLSEPDPLLDRDPLRSEPRFDRPYEPPPLRLVEPDGGRIDDLPGGQPMGPVDEGDGDLLIFAEARSAWFTGHVDQQETDLDWHNAADIGWEAAERAAEPILGEETSAGLPRRVPQANLVPGSALPPEDRNLRIVRDPAAMAAHTTGYFRGSRRGEEVRGFAVGGRPGRESAAGWDFTRDSWDGDRDEGYEYRSAARP